MDNRPTLEEQIAISKLTNEECIQLLMGRNKIERFDFFIFRHAEWLWHILHWNWFDPLK